jgi:hypothetical protein
MDAGRLLLSCRYGVRRHRRSAMATTTTTNPVETAGILRIDVTSEEFSRRLAAHGHDATEIRGLWEELTASESGAPAAAAPERWTSGRLLGMGSVIAVYLGLLLVVAASVSLLVIYGESLGAGGVLVLAVVYLVVSLGASEALRHRDLVQPADVLEAVSIGWVGLATYALLELIGVWPDGASDLGRIHVGLTTIAVVGLATALLLLVLRPDPLLIVPMAAATAALAVGLAELLFGESIDDLNALQIGGFLLPVGLTWIAIGLWLDVTGRRRYAAWAHLAGLILTAIAVGAVVPKTVPGFALVGALGALALFFSAFVRHWSFTVIGAMGVLMATMSAMGLLGGIAPVVIAMVGVALVVVGLRWSRWRVSIRHVVIARMPRSVRSFVTRLSPQ